MAELSAIGYKKIKSGPMFEVHKVKVTKAEGVMLAYLGGQVLGKLHFYH
jgi:hypothetical protein